MADRFWVGNGGNINDTAHWSLTSGGAGGASVPTLTDNAKFDALSFTLAGQTVTVNAAFNCLDMDWTGATNSPTFSGTFSFNIYGSLTLISAMTITANQTLTFKSTSTGRNITTAGQSLPFCLVFDGVGGGWTFQDNITNTHSNGITITNGALNTNGKTIVAVTFDSNNLNVRSVTLGASTITLSSIWNFNNVTNLTFSAGTSSITISGLNFLGGGLTYNNVKLNSAIATLSGSNTFNVLTFTAGKTVKLTSGTTQTVTSLVCNGTTASPSTLQSVTAGSAATITLPVGRYFIRHTSIKDITISGATTVTSIAGTNVSGNTGITFVTKFEMGRIKNDGSFNWYNSTTGTVTKVSG